MAGGTAFWAHLGGFIAGLLLSVILRAPKAASIEFGHEVLEQMNERGPAASLHATEQHLKKHPEDIEAHRQRLEALQAMDDPEAEARALVETIKSGPAELAAELVLRLQELSALGDLPPALSARLAEEFKTENTEAAILLLESILKLPADHPSRPDALLSLALLLEKHDEVRSGRLLKELSQSYGLHGAASVARAKGLIE
jgi:hypothetical protein